MSFSVKLSSSLVRPIGLSFSRHNGLLQAPCGPLVVPHNCLHQRLHHTNDSSVPRPTVVQDHRSSLPVLLISRSVSSAPKQQPQQEKPLRPAKDEPDHTLLSNESTKGGQNDPAQDSSKPTEEQLAKIHNRFAETLPQFFKNPHDFGLYNRRVVFEDNIRNVQTVGINAYAWQIAKIKMGAHFKYGLVRMDVLKITSHVEDSTVRVRWRVVTYPGNSIVFAFWKFNLSKAKEEIATKEDEWVDGFSIFHVGSDGLIYKHVCDNVIPDTDKVTEKKVNLGVKLAVALGLIAGDEFGFGENFITDLLMNFAQ